MIRDKCDSAKMLFLSEGFVVSLRGLVTSPKALFPPHVASRSIQDPSTP
jgi:hypothetical protein